MTSSTLAPNNRLTIDRGNEGKPDTQCHGVDIGIERTIYSKTKIQIERWLGDSVGEEPTQVRKAWAHKYNPPIAGGAVVR